MYLREKFTALKINWVITGIILIALFRLIQLPPNISPMTPLFIFGAAYFKRSWLAWLIPMAALLLSNFLLDNILYSSFYEGIQWWSTTMTIHVIAFTAVFLMARGVLNNINLNSYLGTTIIGTILFFLISNFAVWISGVMYPLNPAGLLICYTAALPFLALSFIGNTGFVLMIWLGYKMLLKYQIGIAQKA